MIAAPRPASGAFPLAGRLWQWGQQVSAVIAARGRDSTAVKVISPGVRPAVAAARAASPAIMLCASSSAQASWRTRTPERPRRTVHEGLHTGLFLMDMVYGMFTKSSRELEADENRALSAVKIGQMRPLDKAFHAAVMAIPLMYMQHLRGESTLVDLYSESLGDACKSLLKQREYFTPYGQMLLDEMCAWAENLDFAEVARSISDTDYANYQPAFAA